MLKIGSHVSMSGKDMFLNSVKEAVSYHADTFMLYTGAPQNTKRKDIKDMHLPEGHSYMKEHGIEDFVVHAPYIINLGNSVNPDTYKLAVDFLKLELARTEAMGSRILILHPGAHVGAGTQAGIAQIAKGLNEVLQADTDCLIALETMAGKGSEIGSSFEELAAIYDKVHYNDKLRVCFDTCHVHDSGYDIIHHFDSVIQEFDKLLGLDQICVFHINDSKNPAGSRKDRHENIGFGQIGFDAINYIVHHKEFEKIPKILETPYVPLQDNPKKSLAPYAHEIEMLRKQQFIPDLKKADKSSSAS